MRQSLRDSGVVIKARLLLQETYNYKLKNEFFSKISERCWKMMSERRQQSNFLNPDINPCIEESLLSQKCLDEKLYDYNECALYFENYKQCKKFWGMVTQKRRAAGIKPLLPPKAERDEIIKLQKQGKKVISVEIKK